MNSKIVLYLILFTNYSFTFLSAIDIINVEGYVIDDVGVPLAGSNIIIKNSYMVELQI